MVKTLPEFKELVKSLASPEELFEMLGTDICEQVDRYCNDLMQKELPVFLGRELYKRQKSHSTSEMATMGVASTSRGSDRPRQRSKEIVWEHKLQRFSSRLKVRVL